MPVGDCEQEVLAAARADGITFERAIVPWINRRGHFGLPERAAQALPVLEAIFTALGGIAKTQSSKTLTPLRGDFLDPTSGTFVEVDESQHFTSFRLVALDLYPPDAELGFDREEYRDLCAAWAHRSDRYRANKAAVGFGDGGRQRQRAYNDALRDLVVPLMGHPPVVRLAAPDRNGADAWARSRHRLVS